MIPETAHFIWLGNALPWACSLAVRSALRFGGFRRAILHHEAALLGSSIYDELQDIVGLELRLIDERAMLDPVRIGKLSLFDVYRELSQPAGRANVLRAALLLREGGVYLDTDTITVRSLSALRSEVDAFVGEERIALPYSVRTSKNPWTLGCAVARRSVRDVFRRLPSGWSSFRRVERFYPAAANNAVFGCTAGHPFVSELTLAMLALDPASRRRRFALGTHLLQRVLGSADPTWVRVLPPAVFYPLGPEISEHWFRMRERLPDLEQVILPETLVVHWYASVRTEQIVPSIDRAYVERHRREQLFSALAARVLDPALELALLP